jgi:hypothetical protein
MRLIHGNLIRRMEDPERAAFLRELGADAKRVTDQEFAVMLGHASGWRERLVAAWMAGIDGRTGQRERIGELLIESRQTYAGQGYCFALACFATPSDAEILSAYLDHYLRRPDLSYDQAWAMGALLDVDAQLGSGYAAQFADPGGLWRQWASGHSTANVEALQHRIAVLRTLVEQARQTSPTSTERPDVQLPRGWVPIHVGDGGELEDELASELTAEHPLANRPVVAIAHCVERDQVLFEIADDPTRWVLVVLTGSGIPEPGFRPFWEVFASLETAVAGARRAGAGNHEK